MAHEIRYELRGYVDDELIYKTTSSIMEVIELSTGSAQRAIDKYVVSLDEETE